MQRFAPFRAGRVPALTRAPRCAQPLLQEVPGRIGACARGASPGREAATDRGRAAPSPASQGAAWRGGPRSSASPPPSWPLLSLSSAMPAPPQMAQRRDPQAQGLMRLLSVRRRPWPAAFDALSATHLAFSSPGFLCCRRRDEWRPRRRVQRFLPQPLHPLLPARSPPRARAQAPAPGKERGPRTRHRRGYGRSRAEGGGTAERHRTHPEVCPLPRPHGPHRVRPAHRGAFAQHGPPSRCALHSAGGVRPRGARGGLVHHPRRPPPRHPLRRPRARRRAARGDRAAAHNRGALPARPPGRVLPPCALTSASLFRPPPTVALLSCTWPFWASCAAFWAPSRRTGRKHRRGAGVDGTLRPPAPTAATPAMGTTAMRKTAMMRRARAARRAGKWGRVAPSKAARVHRPCWRACPTSPSSPASPGKRCSASSCSTRRPSTGPWCPSPRSVRWRVWHAPSQRWATRAWTPFRGRWCWRCWWSSAAPHPPSATSWTSAWKSDSAWSASARRSCMRSARRTRRGDEPPESAPPSSGPRARARPASMRPARKRPATPCRPGCPPGSTTTGNSDLKRGRCVAWHQLRNYPGPAHIRAVRREGGGRSSAAIAAVTSPPTLFTRASNRCGSDARKLSAPCARP